jgi:hypothetical protein
MTEEDGRDNTADAHAQAAGGRAAVADAADAFDRTAKERCKFHPHREGGGASTRAHSLRPRPLPAHPSRAMTGPPTACPHLRNPLARFPLPFISN